MEFERKIIWNFQLKSIMALCGLGLELEVFGLYCFMKFHASMQIIEIAMKNS